MNAVNNTISIRQSAILPLMFIALLWLIKIVEFQFNQSLHFLGVHPAADFGFIGILSGPLIHGSFEHLASNSLPLLLLLTGLVYGYPQSRLPAFVIIWIGSGLGTWLFAREAWHFGASGITHGVFFYLLLISIFRRDKRSIALMMIAFFMYGGMTMTILPREEGISFEYHLFGAIAGALAALLFRKADPKPVEKTYSWEQESETDELIGEEWQGELEQKQDTDDQRPTNEDGDFKLH